MEKKIKKSADKAVRQLKELKAQGYQIASATVYNYAGTLFFNREDLQEYCESLRG